jgi:hypothetical protein
VIRWAAAEAADVDGASGVGAVRVGVVSVDAVTVGLQVSCGDGPACDGASSLSIDGVPGETRISQEDLPGLGTLPTSRR